MKKMRNISVDDILTLLSPRLHQLDLTKEDVDNSTSLLAQGVLDSMSFLEFIVEVESNFNIELDLSDLDPSEFTSLDNLITLLNNADSN